MITTKHISRDVLFTKKKTLFLVFYFMYMYEIYR